MGYQNICEYISFGYISCFSKYLYSTYECLNIEQFIFVSHFYDLIPNIYEHIKSCYLVVIEKFATMILGLSVKLQSIQKLINCIKHTLYLLNTLLQWHVVYASINGNLQQFVLFSLLSVQPNSIDVCGNKRERFSMCMATFQWRR